MFSFHKQLTSLSLARSFSCSRLRLSEAAVKSTTRPSPKANASKDPRVLAKRKADKRAKQSEDPRSNPLYMDIPTAMRYMRAAEVGKPASRTTVSLQITVLPEKGSIPLQGSVSLPKSVKPHYSLVFTENPEQLEALEQIPNVTVGGSKLINDIKEGLSIAHFTQAFATPEVLPQLGSVARILGPRSLMPSVKRGMVAEDVVSLIDVNASVTHFKQKRDSLSLPIGRCDFSDEEIIKNIKAASKAIYDLQPVGTKNPNLIGRCTLSTTSGPSVIIDFSS